MALSKIADIRKMSDQELSEGILATKKELFELRLKQATQSLDKPHLFKQLRHKIAQMMTVELERQRASNQVNQDTQEADQE
jgi:large subunit ribosomal protein L29